MKKRFTLLLAITVCISFFAMAAAEGTATADPTIAVYGYAVNAEGNAVITRYTGQDTSVDVPAILNGHTVVGIGDRAFIDCTTITSISLPGSLQSIGEFAFYACTSLISIALPDNLQSVGDRVFADCYALTSIEVSQDNPVFASLDGVLFRKGDKELVVYPAGKPATEYSVPQDTLSVHAWAFVDCHALLSVILPDNVQAVGDGAFWGCFSLTSIEVSPNNPFLESIDGVLFHKECGRLIAYPAGKQAKEYIIPQDIQLV